MIDRPKTRFAWNEDVSLAYQVVGDGPVDVLYLQGYVSQVDMNWESAYLSRFLRGLAQNSRLIITDRRGWGCSERFSPGHVQDIDAFSDDLLVVMDAAGSERAAILATADCGVLGMLFAASHPERTAALILVDAWANYSWTEETPWAPTSQQWEDDAEWIRQRWGTSAWTEHLKELAGAAELTAAERNELDWLERTIRATSTPGAVAAELRRYAGTDVRAVLPTIQVPTLVFVDPADAGDVNHPDAGRFLAARIPGARLVEQRGQRQFHRLHFYDRGDGIVEEVGRFLKGIREEEVSFDRVLNTVLFTDIVGSTERAAEEGDRHWRELLERHHATVRAMLARYRGVEVDTAGDGFFATFDGPGRAIRCAQAIRDAVRALGLQIRAGLHTGEVETINDNVGGIAVSIGARVAHVAAASEVLVSQTVKDLVAGSGLVFEDAGEHELKGVPDRWHLYRVVS